MTDLALLADLPGLISPEAGEVLYRHALAVPSGSGIVELGSYRGSSTAYLAAGARDGSRPPVYAVDAWSDRVTRWSRQIQPASLDEFRSALASVGLGGTVQPLRGLTTRVARAYDGPPVGLLFIDADHAERAALADFRAWRRHLHDGATVVWDDFGTRFNPGVGAAVARLLHGRLRFVSAEAGRLAICEWT